MTDCVQQVWYALRRKQIEGFRFRRQRPIGKYIVDFVCLDAQLIIELDGGQHAEQTEYDQTRGKFLASQGFRVLRFWNSDVVENLSGVLETIHAALLQANVTIRTTPSPAFPSRGEGANREDARAITNTLSPLGGKAGKGAHQVRANLTIKDANP